MLPQYGAGHHSAAASATHPGMFTPGTKVQVGKHRVVVEKYLSEGGFAHVYLVRDSAADARFNPAVLKRVAVPDKDALVNMRTEVETMKKLKGHKHIVTYIDSHASQLQGGGYEVFLLMEFCNGGGLIDFMNTRLQHRLTEPEILKIFSDVALGVACMHYLKPPLLHRDLKVENVLITTSGSSRTYKLCDFGSTAPPRPAAKDAAEGRLIEDDIQRHTTLQYRSPEMIDVYRKQPIDEKSDIWALGVLLYKLCYYTTPFEDQGQMAILNASFKFHSYPPFSDRLKKLITWTLQENPQKRPNIYQVVKEVASIRQTDVPLQDIYANRTKSETRRNEKLPSPGAEPAISAPVGISKVRPAEPPVSAALPEITPMRRGRPTSTAHSHLNKSVKESPLGLRGASSDPFAALDSKDVKVRSQAADELAAKFPSLDEFSLMHDQGANFQFNGITPAPAKKQETLHKRVTDALADEAFATSRSATSGRLSAVKAANSGAPQRAVSEKRPSHDVLKLPGNRSQPDLVSPPPSERGRYASIGVQTSPAQSPSPPNRFDVSLRPAVWKMPPTAEMDANPSEAVSRPSTSSFDAELPPRPEKPSSRPGLLDRHKSRSQNLLVTRSPGSSRPSMEAARPVVADLTADGLSRSRSTTSKPRPSSEYVRSGLDYLKGRESSKEKPGFKRPDVGRTGSAVMDESSDDDGPDNVESNVGFLKELEVSKKGRRSSSAKSPRKSIPSISLAGTKNIITGKFSDAFKRFEGGTPRDRETPLSPNEDGSIRRTLSPISGSEATGGRPSIEETEELRPEVRREIERQQLEQEERRVEAAAAAYRMRVASGAPGDRSRVAEQKGAAIQNRVKNLLDSTKESQVARTAEGYGRFTEAGVRNHQVLERPPIARKPVGMSRPPVLENATGPLRPDIAPKPQTLRLGGPSGLASMVPSPVPPAEDWEANFQKKYPSLAGLEMVETEVRPTSRLADV